MLSARVCKTYVAQYPDPIAMTPGDDLQLGKRDPEYPGWVWATSTRTSKSGWVPEDYVEFAGDQGSARRAFTAREVSVEVDERVTVVEELLGWAWVKTADDREGWVPMSHLMGGSDAPDS